MKWRGWRGYAKGEMENQDIKRGIDFENRVGQTAWHVGYAFRWWQGTSLNRKSWIFIWLGFAINLVLIYPIFGKDVSAAFSSSSFLLLLASFFKIVFRIPERFFLGFLTDLSLISLPVTYYLFVRKIVLRHEFTAVLATLLLILPNPFFYNTPILVNALLNGDGAHVVVFAFLPLLLLYVQSFLAKGIPIWGFLTALATAMVAIISPFAALQLIIFYLVLVVAEGFQGNLRVKLMRVLFLFMACAGLCFFWYSPSVLLKILVLEHVQYALGKFSSVLPLAIPILPVAGALSFLIFDRREKLKPIFIGLALFLIYLTLYGVSNGLNISGVFTADRYLPELVFVSALFLSILFVLLTELAVRNFLPRMKPELVSLVMTALISFGFVFVILLTFRGVGIVHAYLRQGIVSSHCECGIGGVARVFGWGDIVASLVSLGTLVGLVILVRKFPSVRGKRDNSS